MAAGIPGQVAAGRIITLTTLDGDMTSGSPGGFGGPWLLVYGHTHWILYPGRDEVVGGGNDSLDKHKDFVARSS